MTSERTQRGGKEATSKPSRIDSFINTTSDDESEEMERIREKLQRRTCTIPKDDDSFSSLDDITNDDVLWNEDDDDDAFDAKLAAMNVFPPKIKPIPADHRSSEDERTILERRTSHPNNSHMIAGMPSFPPNSNQHRDDAAKEEREDLFSDDDDLIAAIEYSETPWAKLHEARTEKMNDSSSADSLTQIGNRSDISVVTERLRQPQYPTDAIKDKATIGSNHIYRSNPMVQPTNTGSSRTNKRCGPSIGNQPMTRTNGPVPAEGKQQIEEQPAPLSKDIERGNLNPERPPERYDETSQCIYEYAQDDWNGDDEWIIHDSDEEVRSTPLGTYNADPFGFDTEAVERTNRGETHQHYEANASSKVTFPRGKESFLDDAFGFSDGASDTIPSKSLMSQDDAFDRVEPTPASDTRDEKNSEVDPSLYIPLPMDSIQEPIIHHLSPRNRPIPSRRKIPITQVFQGPVASLWKNKFDVFNHVQSEIANMLAYSDDNVVVSAPTGAGKTAVFEMAMARFFEVDIQATPPGRSEKVVISKRRKIVYMSPSKALCEERYADWSKRLSAMNLGIEIAVVTGDGDPLEAYHDLASSHFIITTPEKWDSLTRRWTEKFFLFAAVKLFLVDEVHLIGDKSRGCCLEAVICRMKAIQRAASQISVSQADINMSSYANTSPDAINTLLRFVAVSATLPNIADIAMFFEANEAYIFDESYRPVPLTIHVIGQGKLSMDASNGQFMFWKNLDRNVPELIFRFSNRRPAIVFCHSKADCEKLADLLATTQNIGRRDEATSGMASRTRVSKLQRVLIQGIAYHHAGLEVEDRRLIEESFTQGKIRVLCATSTIAMGVNLPAHLVIIKGTSAYRGAGEGGGYQDIDQASLLQMIGRAGRPGFDTTGTAVIMTDNDSKAKFEQLASSGLSPAMSQLKGLKLLETINTEVSQKVICSITNAINWIKGTLHYLQLFRDPEGHGIKVVSNYSIDTHIHNLCKNAIGRLCAIGTIVVTESQDIYPLPASHIMSQRLVEYEAMAQISKLPFDVSHGQVIKTISMIEGLHCPVRRNEKKTLNATHKSLKLYKLEGPISKIRIQEPWQKSFVLLQAYIEDLEFDDHDVAMKKEMNAMVEYAARTLTAVEEFSIKGTKNGNVAFQCMRIRRSLAVRLWSAKDGMLQQIKGIGKAMAFSFHMNGISTFEDVVNSSEAQLEKAGSRPPPFGRDLINASTSILQSRLKISAQIDQTINSSILHCALKRACETNNDDSESFEKPSTVTYNLLAYTDKPGGLFLVKQNITGPGEYHAVLPQSYGIITIQLVASIVGLDDTLELGEETKKTSQQNNQKVKELGETLRTRIRTNKPSSLLTRSTPHDVRTHISDKKSDNPLATEINSRIPIPTKIIGSRRIPVMSESTTVTPSPKLTPYHSNEKSTTSTTKILERRMQNDPGIDNPGNANLQSRARSPTFHPSIEGTQRNATMKRNLESIYKQTDEKVPNANLSWRRLKTQQQKSQQRAFVRHSDNPFKSYKHDPNDSESYLDQLTTQGQREAASSIIPPEGFDALRPTNPVPTIPRRSSSQNQFTADHRGMLHGPGFHERHAIPLPDMLFQQQANESNFRNMATTVRPSYAHNLPLYPHFFHNQHHQAYPIFPEHFRQQTTTYLSSEYNNKPYVGTTMHAPHDFYPNTNYPNHFTVSNQQPRDFHNKYASMQHYATHCDDQPPLNQYASTRSFENPASGGIGALNFSQFEPHRQNIDMSNRTNTGRHIDERVLNEKDIEAGFF